MALGNQVHKKGRENIAGGDIDYDGAAIKVVLVKTSAWTSFSQATLDAAKFLGDITAAALGTRSASLVNKLITDGVCTADAAVFSAPTGGPWDGLAVYQDVGGSDAARRFIAWIDTGVTGLPVSPNTADVYVDFPAGVVYNV